MLGQQTTGQRPSRARVSGGHAWVVLALAATAGCGELHFIHSPYTAKNVELIYSEQEDITILRWQVDGTPPLAGNRFELLGPSGYQPIDFTQSVYPGGVVECADGRGGCAQYVMRGNYQVPEGARPVQAVHDVYGVLPGGPPSRTTVPETFKIDSYFHPRNDVVYLNILLDTVSHQGVYSFPRRFERAMWPTNGLCLSDSAPDGISFLPLDDSGGFPPDQPLTDEGMYCVGMRPVPADAGASVLLQKRIATQPELVTMTQYYTPPVVRSPVIYQLILDLEIPVEDRCAQVIQDIESLTAQYMAGDAYTVPVHKLPTVNLSEGSSPCAQTNGRVLQSVEIAQAIRQLIITLPEKEQQVHLLYFNNLDGPLPSGLVASFNTLFDLLDTSVSPVGYHVELFSWMFNPGGGVIPRTDRDWWAFWIWQTPDEAFEMKLDSYQHDNLPRTTQIHDSTKPVPILSDESLAVYVGDRIKLCGDGTPPVVPVSSVPTLRPIFDPSWVITAEDPPAYSVSLPSSIAVQASKFFEQSVSVTYQICTRYCVDHGYVSLTGQGVESWIDSRSCGVQN